MNGSIPIAYRCHYTICLGILPIPKEIIPKNKTGSFKAINAFISKYKSSSKV